MGLRSLTPLAGGGNPADETALPIFNDHTRVWDQPVTYLCPSYQSGWLLLHPLVERLQFTLIVLSIMVVLWISCNFDIVVKEGKHSVYLQCHLGSHPIYSYFM